MSDPELEAIFERMAQRAMDASVPQPAMGPCRRCGSQTRMSELRVNWRYWCAACLVAGKAPKTKCVNGHEWTPENIRGVKYRYCRLCHQVAYARWRAKKRKKNERELYVWFDKGAVRA